MRLVGQSGMLIYQLAWFKCNQWRWVIIASVVIVSQGQPLINWDHCYSNYYTVPQCIDRPSGYRCECGPGFYWNTHKCMSSAVDSRFEFKQGEPIRYTVLLNKAFPGLNAFTIAFWVNVARSEHPGTILSYKNRDVNNILITVCWAFAFISLKIVDTILKYLFAMFTSLQGAFFVVFYMFLHEEIRAYIKSRQKRRALQLQGMEYQDNHSLDSFASNSLIDRDVVDGHGSLVTGTLGCGSGSVSAGSGAGQRMAGSIGNAGNGDQAKDARPSRLRELSKRKNRAHIEASSDEGSDCEMISSV